MSAVSIQTCRALTPSTTRTRTAWRSISDFREAQPCASDERRSVGMQTNNQVNNHVIEITAYSAEKRGDHYTIRGRGRPQRVGTIRASVSDPVSAGLGGAVGRRWGPQPAVGRRPPGRSPGWSPAWSGQVAAGSTASHTVASQTAWLAPSTTEATHPALSAELEVSQPGCRLLRKYLARRSANREGMSGW